MRSAPGGRFYFGDTQSHKVLSFPDVTEILLMKFSIQNHFEHLGFCKKEMSEFYWFPFGWHFTNELRCNFYVTTDNKVILQLH